MRCPQCGGKTRVADVRTWQKDKVKRHRRCPACMSRFVTVERLVYTSR